MYNNLKRFINKICAYENNWCDGKHIPAMRRDKKTTAEEYYSFTKEDISATKDIEPCGYFKNNKCQHAKNPKNK